MVCGSDACDVRVGVLDHVAVLPIKTAYLRECRGAVVVGEELGDDGDFSSLGRRSCDSLGGRR